MSSGSIFLALITPNPALGQGPARQMQPDEKWDVKKEYDEHGNLIYYDSSYSRTWKHFEFPGQAEWHMPENLDSMFGDFFQFPEGMLKQRSFSFSPFHKFMDSMNMDFYLDSSIFQMPHGFDPFNHFPDSAWMDGFFPDSTFQDAFVPIEEFFPPSFHGPNEYFDKHQELLEKFRQQFSFPDDSLYQLHPKWQQLPGKQKKRPRGIEI